MVFLLGLACVAWTIIELVLLSRRTPALARESSPRATGPRTTTFRPQRPPLAAWDEQGRPIFVEDVSLRVWR